MRRAAQRIAIRRWPRQFTAQTGGEVKLDNPLARVLQLTAQPHQLVLVSDDRNGFVRVPCLVGGRIDQVPQRYPRLQAIRRQSVAGIAAAEEYIQALLERPALDFVRERAGDIIIHTGSCWHAIIKTRPRSARETCGRPRALQRGIGGGRDGFGDGHPSWCVDLASE